MRYIVFQGGTQFQPLHRAPRQRPVSMAFKVHLLTPSVIDYKYD